MERSFVLLVLTLSVVDAMFGVEFGQSSGLAKRGWYNGIPGLDKRYPWTGEEAGNLPGKRYPWTGEEAGNLPGKRYPWGEEEAGNLPGKRYPWSAEEADSLPWKRYDFRQTAGLGKRGWYDGIPGLNKRYPWGEDEAGNLPGKRQWHREYMRLAKRGKMWMASLGKRGFNTWLFDDLINKAAPKKLSN